MTHFGHIIPPPPVTYSCSVSPASVYPGDPITVTGRALNLNPKKTADLHLDFHGRHDLGKLDHGEHRHQDRGAGYLYGNGPCTEGAKPGQSADCTGAVYG